MKLRIKELRQARGWTQEELASRAGVSRSYLAEMEGGAKTINLVRLQAIAHALSAEVPDLLTPSPRRERTARILALLALLPDEDQAFLEEAAERLARTFRAKDEAK